MLASKLTAAQLESLQFDHRLLVDAFKRAGLSNPHGWQAIERNGELHLRNLHSNKSEAIRDDIGRAYHWLRLRYQPAPKPSSTPFPVENRSRINPYSLTQ